MPPKPSSADDSDDEFEYDAPPAAQAAPAKPSPATSTSSLPRTNPLKASHLGLPRKVLDQPYDEAVDISASSADSVMSADPTSIHGRVVKEPAASAGGKVLSMDSDEEEEEEEEDEGDDEDDDVEVTKTAKSPAVTVTGASAPIKSSPLASPKPGSTLAPPSNKRPVSESEADEEDEEEEEESDEERGAASPPRTSSQAKLYNPADFAHLTLPPDLIPLLTHINSFKPFDIELDTKFLPFIPDYIPAIGEIDPFIKVEPPLPPPPEPLLGLTVVDEPSSNQSDPSTLALTLRVLTKGLVGGVEVGKIEMAHLNERKIQKWIDSVNELHQAKPQTKIHYQSGPMPDLTPLMQAWPAELEATLRQVGCEVGGLDMTVKEMAKLCCALMDIPVYGDDGLHESLHVLFSLYHEFSNNAHFQA